MSGKIGLSQLVAALAVALRRADARRPVWVSRTGREYQPGIGPLPEDEAMRLMLAELVGEGDLVGVSCGQFLQYSSSRRKCDFWIGEPREWAVEAKMARFYGDNGKPDPTAIKDLLSPYDGDRSAVADCRKLAAEDFGCRKAVFIYGFETSAYPLDVCIDAFELLARQSVALGERTSAEVGELVHPVHNLARVFAWEIRGLAAG